MFDWFKNRKGHITQSARLINTSAQEESFGPVPGLIVPGVVFLGPKKWVTVKGKIGIVTAIDASSYVKVALVKPDGTNLEDIRVPVGEVKLARYLEIPECRRGDKVIAATLGYV